MLADCSIKQTTAGPCGFLINPRSTCSKIDKLKPCFALDSSKNLFIFSQQIGYLQSVPRTGLQGQTTKRKNQGAYDQKIILHRNRNEEEAIFGFLDFICSRDSKIYSVLKESDRMQYLASYKNIAVILDLAPLL